MHHGSVLLKSKEKSLPCGIFSAPFFREVNRCFLVVLMFICSEVSSALLWVSNFTGLQRQLCKVGLYVTSSLVCCIASKLSHHGTCPEVSVKHGDYCVSGTIPLLFPSEVCKGIQALLWK